MFQAVILDFDGTLLDTEQHNFRCWQLTAQDVGIELTEDFYRSLVGLTLEDSNQLLRVQYGQETPLDHWRALRRTKFYQLWDQGEGPGWKAGLEQLLPYLNQSPFKKAIASSSLKAELTNKLQRARLLEHFPICVGGDEVAAGKPQPDVFLEAARQLEVDPKYCLAVEDSVMGVIAARAAGMEVVFIPDMIPPDERVRRDCLAVLPSLAEVIGILESGER